MASKEVRCSEATRYEARGIYNHHYEKDCEGLDPQAEAEERREREQRKLGWYQGVRL
ncbi:MAG: hypothetical protein ACP5D2_01230 [Candidatus Nanoarchaeia archaeon]